MKTKSIVLCSFVAGASLALAGCGKSEQATAATPAAPAATAAAAQPPADGVRTIEITANDAMQFSLKEIQAAPGEKLRIAFSNVGKMPKQAMSHNWVLLKQLSDAEVNSFGMSAASKAPTYLPDDKSAVLAHTKLLGAGESDQIDITVPTEPGEYPFICTFPGHFAMMKGKLIVK